MDSEGCELQVKRNSHHVRTAARHRSLGRGRNGELLLGEVSDALALGTTEGTAPRGIPAPTPGPGPGHHLS